MKLLVKNGMIATESQVFQGDILIEDEKIKSIGTVLEGEDAEVIDATGRYVIPGGVGGMWGAIATGLFATMTVNPDGADELLYGGNLLIPQLISLVAAIALAIIGTVVIFKVVSYFMDMRVSISAESLGIDISEHGEGAYNQSEFKSSGRFITSDQHSLV